MNRRALLSGSVAVTMLLMSACGLSPRSDVIDEGPGPTTGAGQPTLGVQPPDWERGLGANAVVDNYLAAAAGDHSKPESRQVVISRIRSYQVAEKMPNWRPEGPDNEISIIRVLERTQVPGTDIVEVRAQSVGVLDETGRIKPASPGKEELHAFTVAESTTGNFKIAGGPKRLLLSEDALKKYYEARFVYFPSIDGAKLLPDLRYLASAVPQEVRATRWVGFALGEASDWLRPAVAKPNATPIGNVIESNGDLVVDVRVDKAGADELIRLFNCLSRTLDPQGRVVLKVDGQDKSREVGQPAKEAKWPSAKKYAIYNGSVWEQSGNRVLLPEEANTHLTAVAIARGGSLAAVVQTAKDREHLRIGPTGPEAPNLPAAFLTGSTISQPIWLDRESSSAVLVLVDDVLHRVTSIGGDQTIALPNGAKAKHITVAPDGRRIAYIAGDRLYTAALRYNGNSVSVGSAEALPISLKDLQGVAFSSLSTLVVAGLGIGSDRNSKVMLVNYAINGVWMDNTPTQFRTGTKIWGLVATPDDALGINPISGIMFVVNGTAMSGAYASPTKIPPINLPVPTPTASPGTKQTTVITAPSFEG